MIREIVRPDEPHLMIDLPREYVGEEIEYIVFPLHRQVHDDKNDRIGVDAIGGALERYADPSARDRESKAWELHIEDKYGS